MKINIKLRKPRNPIVGQLRGRKGGPMKDRREERGGAHNKMRDYLKDDHEDDCTK